MRSPLHRTRAAGRDISIVTTDRSDGDVRPDRVAPDILHRRQIEVTGRRWAMLDEVHGVEVVDVDRAELDAVTAGVGDIAVTGATDTHLAVWTADCAPIFLVADDGTVVGAHGGWRGLADGVVDVAVAAARRSGGRVLSAVLGPAIGPCCYEFGSDDLERVARGVHASPTAIAGITRSGALALDVPATVRSALRSHGIRLDAVGPCTGCDDRWFSHRVRSDSARQATVAVVGS